jgi:hypothetical protein
VLVRTKNYVLVLVLRTKNYVLVLSFIYKLCCALVLLSYPAIHLFVL